MVLFILTGAIYYSGCGNDDLRVISHETEDILEQNMGLTTGWERWEKLQKATTPIPEGWTPNYDEMDRTVIKATLSMYGSYVPLTRHVTTVYDKDYIKNTSDKQMIQAAETIDELMIDVLDGEISAEEAYNEVLENIK